ncbi:MAG: helicase-associated domain-containing protein [Planctomycetota bacterium]|nr:helicase-associated domain-containing protein [Planctomycetota bacterium]
MPKYFVHYLPADAGEDIRAVVEAPSYRAALAQIRRAAGRVTVYKITPLSAGMEKEETPK